MSRLAFLIGTIFLRLTMLAVIVTTMLAVILHTALPLYIVLGVAGVVIVGYLLIKVTADTIAIMHEDTEHY